MNDKSLVSDDEDNVVPAIVVERYEQCMSVFENSGQQHVISSLEMWNALLEIYSRRLWRARFHTSDEWIVYVSELGYTGLSRSTMYAKLNQMKNLIEQGVKQELAAAAVSSVPGAIGMIEGQPAFRAAIGEQDPNEYIKEIIHLAPGEAIKKVRLDKGNAVEMWVAETKVGLKTGEVIGVIVRSDGKKGYTAYDFKIVITPQIPGNQGMVDAVRSWLVAKLRGKNDYTRVK